MLNKKLKTFFFQGGDTTDDNYSTFTDIHQQLATAKKINDKKMERKQQAKEFQRMEKESQLIKEDPRTLLPRSHVTKQALKTNQGQPNPEKNIHEFADLLISKLSVVRKEIQDKILLNKKLNQVTDADSSVASFGPYSSDANSKKRYQQQVQNKLKKKLFFWLLSFCLHPYM